MPPEGRPARSLLLVTNKTATFLSHRRGLAEAARAAGMQVGIACPDDADADRVRALGFAFHPFPLSRSGANPFVELRSVLALVRLFRRVRPDVVHLVTMKPNLYGSLAATLARVPLVVNAITGFGYIFLSHGWRAWLRRMAVLLAYRIVMLRRGKVVIFQNPDDRGEFVGRGLVREQDTVLIKGAGVDTREFAALPEPPEPVRVVLPSRLLKDKGVVEFVDAARALRERGVEARFVLVGGTDEGNPASLTDDEVQAWVDEDTVEWLGHRDDVARVLAGAHLACLPSYREGLPKSLIEAASCGRAIVTCDVPGCREIVRHEYNGLLVPARQSEPLADALERLIRDGALRRQLGRNGRAWVEAEFSQEHVAEATLHLYRVPAGARI